MIVRWLCIASVAGASVVAQQPETNLAPGRLVDIGGRVLHIHCTGSGAPTVVLEAGASAFGIDWSLVQPAIATSHRVCACDRAGHGWSAARPDVDTPARVVRDLHALLTASGEKPPYVMVGASMGGVYVRIYQAEHPSEVAGMVLVDPSTEDGLFAMYQGQGVTIASLTPEQLRSTLPASGSVPIPRRPVQTGAPFDRLAPDTYQLRLRFDQRLIDSLPPSVGVDVVHESSEGSRAALARLLANRREEHPLGALPLVVLTRGGGNAVAHATLARLSTRGRHAVVQGAAHEIHLSTPAAVIDAIRDVAAAARS